MENFCQDHSGTCVRLEKLEGNVSNLWKKWDSIHALLVGTLATGIISLLGVVILLLKK